MEQTKHYRFRFCAIFFFKKSAGAGRFFEAQLPRVLFRNRTDSIQDDRHENPRSTHEN